LKDLGVPDERIFTAPNAVDTELFARLADNASRDESRVRTRHSLPLRYFLYVGRLVRSKGIFDLVEAYARLDEEIHRRIGLVFVGEGADRPELMGRAARIAPGAIQFFGFVHREELPEFYALADALVFPTHSDPWGLVVNEAMSCGLPIIVTSVAGCAADLVQDGWNGFVVPSSDAPRLSAAMARVASDTGLRAEMGNRSRERIAANSPQAWADGLTKAVESVCRGKA
jgi:glycosyltransferase involved in cell wall biosynthesis